jgi:hypothetical protein
MVACATLRINTADKSARYRWSLGCFRADGNLRPQKNTGFFDGFLMVTIGDKVNKLQIDSYQIT